MHITIPVGVMYLNTGLATQIVLDDRACSNHVRLCNSGGQNAYKKHSCRYNAWDWQFMLAECMLKSFW